MKVGDKVDAYVGGQLVDATILEIKKTLLLRRDRYLVMFVRNVWSSLNSALMYKNIALDWTTMVYPKPEKTKQDKFCNTGCRTSKCVKAHHE